MVMMMVKGSEKVYQVSIQLKARIDSWWRDSDEVHSLNEDTREF